MNKKLIIIIISLVILITVGYFTLLRSGAPAYNFRFDQISRGDITTNVTTTGTLNAVISVDVGTQVSGIISKLYADYNSIVKEGQIIALLDTTFLFQSVRNAEANLDRAEAQLADSKRTLDREKALVDKGLDALANYDAILTTYQTDEAAMKQAQASLEGAKINLAYATIYAPIDGVVINRAVNIGQTVAASFSSPTLFTIANDLSKMQVLATVDETDIGAVSIGQEASFTVDAYPDETFKGTISQIRLAPTSVQNVVNYTVVIDVNNDRLELMPGMTANVKVLVASAYNALRVPSMALRFQPPANLIDSTKFKMAAGKPAAKIGGERDSSNPGSTAIDSAGAGRKGDRFLRESDSNQGDDARKLFHSIRDSIMLSHNDSLSQEELRSEVRKVMEARQGAGREPEPMTAKRPTPATPGTKFGIIPTFPEFEKNTPIVRHQSGRSKIWIVNSKGQIEPVFVLTGITDGKYTEITSSDLKPGDRVILGINYSSNASSSQVVNPLAGGGQQRPQGGGFR